MLVHLNYNIDPILTGAGYSFGGDNGYFRYFTSKEAQEYNKNNYSRLYATKNWRFHAVPMSDFSFNLHIDCGNVFGHKFINENSFLNKEMLRIRKESNIK